MNKLKQIQYLVRCAHLLTKHSVCNCSDFQQWWEIVKFSHKKGYLYVGFDDEETLNNSAYILFHEPSNRWVAFHSEYSGRDAIPMCSSPADLFSFYGENVYIHNSNTTRCNLWGDQYTYTVRVYGIEAPNIVKRFDSIALHTNKYFDVSDVQIPATLNYPNGMKSRIKEARFKKEEGVLRSNYLCNMKTTSATANVKDLFNGDRLRGYIIYNDLDGDETVEHNLYKVDILSTPSKY